MGGLHIALNFIGVMGRHVESSGLTQVWEESGLFGSKTAEKVLRCGRPYNKAVRAHKLTWQALWDILLPIMLHFIQEKNEELHAALQLAVDGDLEALAALINTPAFRELHQEFYLSGGPNRRFWMDYLEMVGLLLRFIRAQRTGDWRLHLDSFEEMLPWFFIYDHQNYAR